MFLKHVVDNSVVWFISPGNSNDLFVAHNNSGPVVLRLDQYREVPPSLKPRVETKKAEVGDYVWFEPGYTGKVVEVLGHWVRVESLIKLWRKISEVEVVPVLRPGTLCLLKGSAVLVVEDTSTLCSVIDYLGTINNVCSDSLEPIPNPGTLISGLQVSKRGCEYVVAGYSFSKIPGKLFHTALAEESIKAIWPQILQQVGTLLAADLAKAGLPTVSGPDALELCFSPEHIKSYEFCQTPSSLARLEATVSRVLGRPCTVRMVAKQPG